MLHYTMAQTNTAKFLSKFDPENETHVVWLSHMIDLAEAMGNPESHIKLVAEINMNPMKIKLDQRDALDWPHIHFVLCASYAKAVLKKKAWISV
jgi:hypothetical protein